MQIFGVILFPKPNLKSTVFFAPRLIPHFECRPRSRKEAILRSNNLWKRKARFMRQRVNSNFIISMHANRLHFPDNIVITGEFVYNLEN